jgi:hypothetical protein
METVFILAVAFAIAVVGGYVGYQFGRRDSERLWRWQMDALADQIKINQKITHTPMVNGDTIISVMNSFGARVYHEEPS